MAAGLVLCAPGCGDAGGRGAPAERDRPTVTSGSGAARPALCGPLRRTITGRVDGDDLTELSGLATSARDPGLLWAVEDSGGPASLVGLRPDGAVAARVSVSAAANVDWEDVGTVPGRVVVADIGDNGRARDGVELWVVPEPAAGAAATAPATRLGLRYPDGAHDAETLLADPVRDEAIVVTKAARGARAYTTTLTAGPRGTRTLRRGPTVPVALATGGAVSGDGRIVAIRSYTGFVVWRRHGREPLERTLGRDPDCVASAGLLREGQGEAIALDRRGRVARTVAEATRAPLRRYGRRGSR